MPTSSESLPGPLRLSVLRLDADSYESTMDILVSLYDLVTPGGFVIVDDFHLDGARRAVWDFRAARNISDPMLPVPDEFVNGCHTVRTTWIPYQFVPEWRFQLMFWRKQREDVMTSP